MVGLCVQHFLLLVIEHYDRQETFTLYTEQAVQSVLGGIVLDIVEVAADTPELVPELFPDLLH